MKPILYASDETKFVSNGLGRLPDVTKCLVTEERNGQYELEMVYPVTGLHYNDICEERIIAARHDDTGDIQPFRIYKITRPMNGKVTVYARHISYQLSKVVVTPFTAETCADALSGLIDHAKGDCPFTIWTDRQIRADFSVSLPTSFRSLLGGTSGSILDVYGPGEYEWDKYTVKYHTQRGTDANVMIRYGKNMISVKKTTDSSNVWNGVVPYWTGADEAGNPIRLLLPEKVVYANEGIDLPFRKVIPLDLSEKFDEPPREEALRSAARAYIAKNAYNGFSTSIDVSFVALWQTEEYKDVAPLQKLKLCDSVTVYHKGLGIENKAKIVSVTYDVILERYEKMTIGETRTSLDDSIRAITSEVKKEVPTSISVSQAINLATNLLSGGQGGNIMINTNASGQPVEILILDTLSINTASKVLRLNKSGISYSVTGYTGEFSPVLSMSGELSAEVIKGIFDAALIKKGTLADKAGNITWNIATGLFSGNSIEITAIEAETITAQALNADTVTSGNGYTGSFYIPKNGTAPGKTVTVQAGIITGVVNDTT